MLPEPARIEPRDLKPVTRDHHTNMHQTEPPKPALLKEKNLLPSRKAVIKVASIVKKGQKSTRFIQFP